MIQFDSFMQAEGVPIYQQIIRYQDVRTTSTRK